MKVKVGYITSWRRAIFFTFMAAIILFGIASTVSRSLLGAGLLSNIVSVGALCIGIAGMILVFADRFGLYEGEGHASLDGDTLHYHDKKRRFEIPLTELKKADMEPVTVGNAKSTPLAYRLLLETGRKKYYIESERAFGRAYDEVDLHRFYIFIQEKQYERTKQS